MVDGLITPPKQFSKSELVFLSTESPYHVPTLSSLPEILILCSMSPNRGIHLHGNLTFSPVSKE